MHPVKKRWLHGTTLLIVCLLSLIGVAQVVALPLHTGDIDNSGERDILDVSCYAATVLAEMQGAPLPGCLDFTVPEVDLQCNDSLDVTDVQRSILLVLYGLTNDPGIGDLLDNKDPDMDLLHNGCDLDDDNDTFPDVCELEQNTSPTDPNDFPLAPNACTCPGGCFIVDNCVANSAINPENACESCDPGNDPVGWTAGSGGPCDDNDLCTTNDLCSEGVCVGGEEVTCGSGGECEGSTCIPEVGCVVLPTSGGPCDDGNLCTANSVCDNGVCGAGEPVDCDDNDPCTVDSCDEALGCQTANAPDGTTCTDEDDCTVGDACLDGSCTSGVTAPECFAPPGTACTLTGTTGDEVDCLIRVARATASTPTPSGIQFNLEYSADLVKPIQVLDELCPNGGATCFDVEVPPAALSPTGHSVALLPPDFSNWGGAGSFVIANAGAPTIPLTDAAYDEIDPSDTETGGVFRVRFAVLADLGEDGAYISIDGALGTTSAAAAMSAEVIGGIIVLSGGNCTVTAECNDGNPCTDDACAGSICIYESNTNACDDGDACTGPDFCTDGECESEPLSCDDNDACTLDTCLGGVGCVHGPIALECDDGDPCTDDICDPATGGCSASPSSAGTPCDDGDACTVNDQCNAGTCGGENPAEEISSECHLFNKPICVVAGSANEIVDCDVHVARVGLATPTPSALQASILYPPEHLMPVAVIDEVCFGQVCFMTDVPPASLYPTGHTVQLAPESLNDWGGSGTLIISNPASPTTALTTAYKEDAESLTQGGDSHIVTLQFKLLVDAEGGVGVALADGTGATSSGAPMGARVEEETILLQAEGCAANPSICDDGVSCKTSSCEVGSTCCAEGETPGCNDSVCEAAVCALDDYCCEESWDSWCVACATGGYGADGIDCSGVPQVCNLDCQYSPSGTCVYELNDSLCDDGDDCTSNVCNPSQGCQVTEDLCGP